MHQEQHTYTHLPSFHIRVLVRPNTRTIVITHIVYLTLTLVTLFGVTYDTSTPTSRYRTLKKYNFYISKMDLYYSIIFQNIDYCLAISRFKNTLILSISNFSQFKNYGLWYMTKMVSQYHRTSGLPTTPPLFFLSPFWLRWAKKWGPRLIFV